MLPSKSVIISFTGTRTGMTSAQTEELYALLSAYRVPYGYSEHFIFRHGDCQGSDAQAHEIAFMLGAWIHVHPPDKDTYRAWCQGPSRVFVHPPLPYLTRNRVMVDTSDQLIAAPRTAREAQRSGTWSTIRYARKQHKLIHILAQQETSPC